MKKEKVRETGIKARSYSNERGIPLDQFGSASTLIIKQIGDYLNARLNYYRKQPMELIDEFSGLMKCRVCGQKHLARSESYCNKMGDKVYRYKRGSWQCFHGCKI